jgi:hypothetical protein
MNYLDSLSLAKKKIAEADAILVGAGAGLSTAAGLVYDGEDWKKNFADFIAKYHFPNLYYGGFGPFESPEENGPIGADSFGLNVMPRGRSRSMRNF